MSDGADGCDGADGSDGPGVDFDAVSQDGLSLGMSDGDGGDGSFDVTDLDDNHGMPDDITRARRSLLDRESIGDQLLLSYDHCDVYNGGNSCLGGGYRLVDAVKGTFEDDVFDPAGSRRPLEERHLTPRQIEAVKRIADDPGRRLYGIHVTNHGQIVIDQEFGRIAKELGCVRIDQVTPNFFASSETLTELADWNNWRAPFTRHRVPAGFYPNATGTTRIWKQYWQVAHKKHPWDWLFEDYGPKHNPNWAFDAKCNTILEVTGVTWFYREACDFETRFHIKVVSLPYLDPYDKRWGILLDPFRKYQKAARQLAEAMLRRLKAAPPETAAIQRRGEILRRLRAERDRRLAQAKPAPAPACASDDRCGSRPCGADLGAALAEPLKTETVRVVLPRRKN